MYFDKFIIGQITLNLKANAFIFYCFTAKEKENVKKFVNDMVQKKPNLTVEIHSVKTMLEKVIEHWDRYGSTVQGLQTWLEEAEDVLQHGDENKKMVSDRIVIICF